MSWAVIQELGGKQMLTQLKGRIKVGKQLVQITSALAYNKVYKIINGQPELADLDQVESFDAGSGNNKDFFDSNTAQTLNQEQILEIRNEQGGEALIDQLVQNSSTFAKKSVFAQEKYLKKKKNKHLALFRVLQATAGNIADTLYISRPQKGIKADALYSLLGLANVHYFAKVAVNDSTGGVVLGAVMERTSLPVTCVYTETIKEHALKYFGFRKHGNDQLISKELSTLDEEFDSIIVCSKDLETFQKIFNHLKPSGTFAAFNQDILTCAKIYDWIMSTSLAANVVFEEMWSREYQVLPQRTHPDMNSRIGTSGGYIVSGIKLLNN